LVAHGVFGGHGRIHVVAAPAFPAAVLPSRRRGRRAVRGGRLSGEEQRRGAGQGRHREREDEPSDTVSSRSEHDSAPSEIVISTNINIAHMPSKWKRPSGP